MHLLVSVLMSVLALFRCGAGTLPAPTGPQSVGTRILYLSDGRRSSPDKDGAGRPVVVQLWYPAEPGSGTGPAPYFPAPALLELMVDLGYYGQPVDAIRSWGELDTHARLDADFAAGGPFSVLLFSHGLGCARASY